VRVARGEGGCSGVWSPSLKINVCVHF